MHLIDDFFISWLSFDDNITINIKNVNHKSLCLISNTSRDET